MDQSGFMPHGHCYLWKPTLVWTHFLSDLMIGLAYILIAALLYALVRKIRLPFGPVFVAFGVFIGACGMTHFMEVWTLWNPDYWVAGFVKVVTALASVATGLVLIPLRPKVIALANAAQLSEERKVKLQSAHAELETLYDKVKETDQLKTQFFANVSHELRTPLALILGPIDEILAEGQISESQRRKLEIVMRNSKTLLKQVNDLLDISKLEAGRMTPNYAKSDLVKLFRYVAAHFETVMQSRNIFFSLHAPDSVPAEVDPEKIQRVYMNLISNAVKYIPDGGRIRVSIQASGDEAVFSIEDTGPGIPYEMRQTIFERFRQVEGGVNRKVGGTGLGLAIVKDFVEMHGGSVRLLETSGHGATFVVKLPINAPPGTAVIPVPEFVGEIAEVMIEGAVHELQTASITRAGALEEDSLLAPKPQAPTILVCEDNPDMNHFVSETLRSEFNVLRAIDGIDGLGKAKAARPDLIVSDIMMPYMSGDELVRELKKDETLRDIPILLLSARADDEMRVRLLREGASDYLVKPFAADELRARASNLVALKTTRDVLKQEVAGQSLSLVELARELGARKREAELAYEVAKAAREEAERASEVKSAFLRLVSHELNTPLMAMNLTIQFLQRHERDKLAPSQRELVDRLAGSSQQLKSLVEGLLEYIRGGRSDINHLEPVDLRGVVQNTISSFKTMAEERHLELRSGASSEPVLINSDPTKIKVILNNLIVNALKFTERGYVEIGIEKSAKSAVIRVRDTGPGVPKADQERIFKPFERLEPLERKSVPGIGLGLALVKQLVDALHGQINIESEDGTGTTFIVELPSDPQHPIRDIHL